MSKCNRSKSGKNCEEEIIIDGDNPTNRINWFPGHMNKAIKEIKKSLKKVDIVLEIRDARSPLVTGNKAVNKEIGQKNRLIVINKANLADTEKLKLWDDWFSKQDTPYIILNDLESASIKKIIQQSRKIIHQNRLQSNPDAVQKDSFKMIIIGLPNTGKSTIINKLAKRPATKAADKPGQTTAQFWVKIDKDLEILDTPGVMPPKIDKYEHGLWLSALHAIPSHIVPPETTACFLVEHLLKEKSEVFKERYKLENFDLGLVEALDHISKVRGCIKGKGQFDYERTYNLILNDFRNGLLGRISFGIPPVKN